MLPAALFNQTYNKYSLTSVVTGDASLISMCNCNLAYTFGVCFELVLKDYIHLTCTSNCGQTYQQSYHRRSCYCALGIIYGDIGTSPLYVFNAIISGRAITEDLIIGSLSCII